MTVSEAPVKAHPYYGWRHHVKRLTVTWARWLHIYLSMVSFAIVLFFRLHLANHRRENCDTRSALHYLASQFAPRLIACNVRGGRALAENQHRILPTVFMEACHGLKVVLERLAFAAFERFHELGYCVFAELFDL